MNARICLVAAGLFGAAAVAMGAFQAHGMEPLLERRGLEPVEIARRVELCGTAVRYLLVHAVALLAVSGVVTVRPASKWWSLISFTMILGCVLFSGSLLGLSLAGLNGLSRVAPYGGTTLIVSWLMVGAAGFARRDGGTAESINKLSEE